MRVCHSKIFCDVAYSLTTTIRTRWCQRETQTPRPGNPKFPPVGSLRGLGRTHEAGLEPFFEPIRIASDVEGDRVMQDPIEDSLGDDAVTEHLAPAPKASGSVRSRRRGRMRWGTDARRFYTVEES
jgi:hypothetical protein